MIVMKFGGTSVGTRARFEQMTQRVDTVSEPVVVVVSAMGGTTDQLLEAGAHAEAGDWNSAAQVVEAIRERHRAVCDEDWVDVRCDELAGLLRGISLVREISPRSRALLVSFGERLSAPIAARTLTDRGLASLAVDARDILVTDARYHDARVDMEASAHRASQCLLPMIEQGQIPVVTGFIAATKEGVTTTLGRGGSDYTAALLGGLLGAREVWIWTDVDGILTADPRLVSEARTLPFVSFREAAEMSYFGARVLHPRTLLPCMVAGVPIRIRSSLEPEAVGTLVSDETERLSQGVKTVTAIRDMALVTLEGRGMAGTVGVARRIFEATEASGANVVMISQASSEQTVSLVVGASAVSALVERLEAVFALELRAGLIDGIGVRPEVAILSIIGQGMAGTTGVSGKLFGALGAAGVNVRAIAQGASELSISVAIEDGDATRAVRAVHTAFGLTRVVHVMMIGCGRVGKSLLTMVEETRAAMAERDLELRVIGVARSRTWWMHRDGDPQPEVARPGDEALVAALVAERFTDLVIVDVTASPLASLHLAALRAGFHVVTANKVPLSGSLASYDAMVHARDARGIRYEYETTFGAGLPVLHTLKELVHTGDEVVRVTGCFSGTLGFVCTRLGEGASLADAVGEATELGYTEPDPREDLSGRDVARKALIIARAMGRKLEPEDVVLDALVPGLDAGLDAAITAFSPILAARISAAAERGAVLRYVASIGAEGVSVGLREVPGTGPIGSLRGPDNILVFESRRYATYPLVIRGPGAGAEVTAAGVLGDLLKVAQSVT